MFGQYGLRGTVDILFPPVGEALIGIGIIGLVTNILFNLTWQFIDVSTWQAVIAGSLPGMIRKTKRDIIVGGFLVFATIGTFGTFLGAAVRGIQEVAPENIVSAVLQMSSGPDQILVWVILVLTAACVISLIDGMLLAAAQTISVDLLPSLGIGKKPLARVRLIVIGFAGVSVWGVDFLIRALGGNLFDFVYVLIVCQLSLIGPVIFSLIGAARRTPLMVIPILLSLVVGFGLVILAAIEGNSLFIDGAGSAAIVTSIVVSAIILGPRVSKRPGRSS
jgi:hypothetical protein